MALLPMEYDDDTTVIYPVYTNSAGIVTVNNCTIRKHGNLAQITLGLVAKRDIAIGETIELTGSSNIIKPKLNAGLSGFSGNSFLNGILYESNGNINIRVLSYVYYNSYGVTLLGTFMVD